MPLRHLAQGYTHSKYFREVSLEHLCDAALTFSLILKFIEVLCDQIADGVRRLELEWQYPFGREDPQQHLHPMLELLCSGEPFSHSALDPSRHIAVPFLVALTLGSDACTSFSTTFSIQRCKVMSAALVGEASSISSDFTMPSAMRRRRRFLPL
jgi:hypothetical protein